MASPVHKKTLREEIKPVLAGIADKSERSQVLLEEAIAHQLLKPGQVISIFLSRDDEVDTTPIIEYCWNNGIVVCIPEFHNHEEGQPIDLHEYQQWGELDEFDNGVSHPRGGRMIPLEDVDVVFVPGLLFTKDGGRLGRGGGFFDQMLSTFMKVSAGLCFKEQLREKLPMQDHDVEMDMVLVC